MSSAKGQAEVHSGGAALRWQGKVVSAAALQRRLNGHRTLLVPAGAIITPLAAEQLRERRVTLQRIEPEEQTERSNWAWAQDAAYPLVASAIQSLAREGAYLRQLPEARDDVCRWAKELAEAVAAGMVRGTVVFCADPALVCCIANKVRGVRAAAVATVLQAARAMLSIAPNLTAVEMPGRTYFEIRQILRMVCQRDTGNGVTALDRTLGELEPPCASPK